MNQELELEVIITEKEDIFTAQCLSLPNCKGKGPTEKVALSKLSKSISNYISRLIHKNIEPVLTSKDYSNIVSDPKDTKKSQHRLYKIASKASPNQKLLFQLKPLTDHIQTSTQQENDIHNIIDLFQPQQSTPSKSFAIDSEEKNESYLFGLPISLN